MRNVAFNVWIAMLVIPMTLSTLVAGQFGSGGTVATSVDVAPEVRKELDAQIRNLYGITPPEDLVIQKLEKRPGGIISRGMIPPSTLVIATGVVLMEMKGALYLDTQPCGARRLLEFLAPYEKVNKTPPAAVTCNSKELPMVQVSQRRLQ